MSREMRVLKSQMQEMKEMLKMSLDMQMDIQRAIRQEVAAAVAANLGSYGSKIFELLTYFCDHTCGKVKIVLNTYHCICQKDSKDRWKEQNSVLRPQTSRK